MAYDNQNEVKDEAGNTYEELLDRVFNILRDRDNNLELAGDRRMIVLRLH
ncbi:unnamed protein product, partial [Prunus brigantina]